MSYLVGYPEILVKQNGSVEVVKLTDERIHFQSALKDDYIKTYAHTYTVDNSKPIYYVWINQDIPFYEHIWISNEEFWK